MDKVNLRIAILGNKNTTEFLFHLLKLVGVPVSALITLSPEGRKKASIAGETELSSLREISESVIEVNSYSLADDIDHPDLSDPFDVVLVVGWQRIIPNWFLSRARIGVFGTHGSHLPLPEGRGRSPLNWSIIKGCNGFTTNLFRYSAGMDDGHIYDSRTFSISCSDTGNSLQLKNTLCMASMVVSLYQDITSGVTPDFMSQSEDVTPSYYPKRRKKDGQISWSMPIAHIDKLVRAVTRPFPGAYCFHKPSGTEVIIWSCSSVLIDNLGDSSPPGTILSVSNGGDLAIKAIDGIAITSDYSVEKGIILNPGDLLFSSAKYAWDENKLPMPSAEWCSGYTDIPKEYRQYF